MARAVLCRLIFKNTEEVKSFGSETVRASGFKDCIAHTARARARAERSGLMHVRVWAQARIRRACSDGFGKERKAARLEVSDRVLKAIGSSE